jgi:hypothetical protein
MEWLLILNLHAMNPREGAEPISKLIEVRGFSTEKDCEAAGQAAGEVSLAKEGPLNGLIIECKRLD